MNGDIPVRQESNALTSFDHDDLIVTLSLELLQEKAREGVSYGVHKTPFGNAVVAVLQNRLCGLVFQGNMRSEYVVEQAQAHLKLPLSYYRPETIEPFLEQIFSGRMPPLWLGGTPFQIEVWKHLLTIPKGAVLTYQELARDLGKPRAMRSVGQALKANPLAYVFPCHRVVSSSGKIGGYRWGTGLKERLLNAEGYESVSPLAVPA